MSFYRTTLDGQGPEPRFTREEFIERFRKYLRRYKEAKTSNDVTWLNQYGSELHEIRYRLAHNYQLSPEQIAAIEESV